MLHHAESNYKKALDLMPLKSQECIMYTSNTFQCIVHNIKQHFHLTV